jgi:lactate racemase
MDRETMPIQLPYGKGTLSLDVPAKNLLGVILPKDIVHPEQTQALIKKALENPMGTDRLSEIAKSGDRVAIVVDDYTRPCPNKELLLPVLEELKLAGVNDSDVIVIVASGTHKPPSFDMVKDIVGDKVFRNYTVISNDSVNGEFLSVGKSKRGNNIEVLKDYVDADIKILLGDIEYHYFAGYGGTRKSILPGISSNNTIQNNHKLMFEEHARTGVLKDNPIHLEMNEAMHFVGCDFALSVVLNSSHRIIDAWAGRPESVLDAGVKLVDEMYKRQVEKKSDIIVVSADGHPHDIDLYQSIKALHNSMHVLNEKGVVILVAECINGHGSQMYVDWLKNHKNSKEVEASLKKNFIMGAHKAYYHLAAIEKHPVIFVSAMDKFEVENVFKFKYAGSVNEALKNAFEIAGKDAKVLVVPHGTTTLLCK